jgi:hypothetical protein
MAMKVPHLQSAQEVNIMSVYIRSSVIHPYMRHVFLYNE